MNAEFSKKCIQTNWMDSFSSSYAGGAFLIEFFFSRWCINVCIHISQWDSATHTWCLLRTRAIEIFFIDESSVVLWMESFFYIEFFLKTNHFHQPFSKYSFISTHYAYQYNQHNLSTWIHYDKKNVAIAVHGKPASLSTKQSICYERQTDEKKQTYMLYKILNMQLCIHICVMYRVTAIYNQPDTVLSPHRST